MALRHSEVRNALSCWVNIWAKIDKFLNYCNHWTVIDNGSSSLLPKLGLLSSASSPRAWEMQPLMPSSQVQIWGVQAAWQRERHHRHNPDLKMSCRPNDTPFLPVSANSSSKQPVVNKSGANMHYTLGEHRTQLWTKHSQFVYRITENVVVGFWWNLASQAPCLCEIFHHRCDLGQQSVQIWSVTCQRRG